MRSPNRSLSTFGLALLVTAVSASCSDQTTGGTLPETGGVAAGGTSASGRAPVTGGAPLAGGRSSDGAAATGGTPDSGGKADAAGAGSESAEGGSLGDGGQPGELADANNFDAPTTAQALDTFLELGKYKSWTAEPSLHRGRGPHGRDVRVFYGPKAAGALTARAEAFPRGAAVIKEIVVDNAAGWAVWVKAADDSDGGNSFFWYELIVGSDNTRTAYAGTFGAAGCVSCHSGGRDYLLADGTFE